MNFKGVEEDIMLKSGCAAWKTTTTGEEVIVRADKTKEYYDALDETAKLATIKIAKWVQFFGIVSILGLIGGVLVCGILAIIE